MQRTAPRNPEIGAPCSLALGIGQHAGVPVLIGLTLQHPPAHLHVQAGGAALLTSGARAAEAYAAALRVQQHYALPPATIELELATPVGMGLDSGACLGLAAAHALFTAHRQPVPDLAELAGVLGLQPAQALEAHGSTAGGLLLVVADPALALPAVQQHLAISHPNREAWALVLFLPRLPDDAPPPDQAALLHQLLVATAHLPTAASDTPAALVAAAQQNDFAAFAAALMQTQQHTHAALHASGNRLPDLPPAAQHTLQLLEQAGVPAYGRSLGGLAVFGLVQGARASIQLRKQLRATVGIEHGRFLATITDNRGIVTTAGTTATNT